tara:strand:- start:845 stop:1129 length:285 start_codon:yes stop_codon:yes gene_type:complete
MALRLIAQGWQAAAELGSGKFRVQEKSRYITRKPHPEMEDVEQGDELLVVNFIPDEEFQQRVKESDSYISQSLRDRIEELEEDEDDDGDIIARV